MQQNNSDAIERPRLQGFVQAGEQLGVFDKSQATELMERAHQQVFAASVAARRADKRALQQFDEQFLELPTFYRRGQSTASSFGLPLEIFTLMFALVLE